MRSPLNKFTVAIEKPFMDEVQTASGIKLYRDTTFNPSQYAATHGTVTALPLFLKTPTSVQEGDQVFFSYHVVMDRVQRERDTDVHKNMIFYKQNKYWLVDNSLVYFSVRDDKISMQNGYVLLDIIEEEVKSTLIIPDYLKKVKHISKAKVIASGNNDVSVDDIVFFDSRFVETYELWGNDFYILKQERILARLT